MLNTGTAPQSPVQISPTCTAGTPSRRTYISETVTNSLSTYLTVNKTGSANEVTAALTACLVMTAAMRYLAVLGREADAAGKAYWLSQLETDGTLRDVVEGFMAAEEMRSHDLTSTQWDFIA